MLRKFIKGLFGSEEQELKSVSLSQLIDLAETKGEIGSTFRSVVNNGYKQNGVVFGAVQLVASAVGTIPWVVTREDTEGEKVEIDKHPLTSLLKRPNPRTGGSRFFEQMIVYLLVGGTDYILKTKGGGKTRNLYNLRPDLVSLRKEGDPESGWVYTPNPNELDNKQYYDAEDILPLHIFDPLDEFSGLSPIEVASLTIEQSNYSRKWNRNLLKNNARPSGLLKATGNVVQLTKDQIEAIEAKFAEKYFGARNAGRIPVLSGSLDWVTTGLTPGEMEWIQGQKVADRLTSFTMGVASQLLGDTEASTFSNYAEARKSLYQEHIIPLMTWIRDELENWLVVPEYGEGIVLDFQRDSIDALQEDRALQWERVGKADWLTVNEKRIATGYDNLDGPAGESIVTQRGILITPDGEVMGPGTMAPLDVEGGGDPEVEEDPVIPVDIVPATDESSVDLWKTTEPRFKAFNIQNEEEAIAHGKAFDGDREQFVEAYHLRFMSRLNQERRELVAAIAKVGSADAIAGAVDGVLDGDFDIWKEVYHKLYMEVGEHFARRVIRSLPKGLAVPNPKMIEAAMLSTNWKQGEDEGGEFVGGPGGPIEGDIFDPWKERMESYLDRFSSTRIVGIDHTTRDQIREQLVKGSSRGEGINDLARRIDGYLEKIYAHRAETVARTEVINASNSGAYFGAELTGIAKTKTWLSVLDNRTRHTHLEADKQSVPFDEPFMVGGFGLLWPGDSSMGAPGYEVINCRCTLTFQS